MVNISKFGDSAIKFKFTDNDHYLFNGEIEVPINSLLLVLDESDMVTFKKIDGDPFVSFLISNSNFASKNDLENFYKTSMVGSTGGGSESGITSGDVQTMIDTSLEDYYDIDEIDAALSGKADTSAVTEAINSAVSGKADTSAVTESINAAVSGKADSSAVTEAITDAVSGKADTSSVYTKGEVDTALSGKQDTLESGTNIKTINNESLLGSGNIDIQGGGSSYTAGRGISIENNEISFNLPISAGTGANSIVMGEKATANGAWSFANGNGNILYGTSAAGERAIAIGYVCEAKGNTSIANGQYCTADGIYSHAIGSYVNAFNNYETSIGQYNVSNTGTTNAANTLFSVGNGTNSARHNAFEIRQNGDIYITKDGADVKLQDNLGGGVTVDPSLDSGSTNAVSNSAVSAALNVNSFLYNVESKNTWDGHPTGTIQLRYRNPYNGNTGITRDIFALMKINNIPLIEDRVSGINNLNLVETSAITTSITSSSTDAQVPSAKAVYDALQESGGGGVSESAFTSYSAATDARISEDEEVTAAALNALNDGKQDTLIAGSGITISGNVISAEGGNLVIELTQAEYDALVDKDPNAFYIITDATEINISDYYTSAQTQSAINAAVSGKQDTLIAGSGITISGNVISANGGGGSITVDTALDSGSTNPVENRVIYDKFDEVEQVTAAALNALNDNFDGLRLKKLTQAEYEALTVKDNNTLYILVG